MTPRRRRPRDGDADPRVGVGVRSADRRAAPVDELRDRAVFALANAGIVLSADAISTVRRAHRRRRRRSSSASSSASPSFSWLAVRLGLGRLPDGARWGHIVGVGAVAGIGFTVSLFITGLAFDAPDLQDDAKIGTLIASVVAAVAGAIVLAVTSRGDDARRFSSGMIRVCRRLARATPVATRPSARAAAARTRAVSVCEPSWGWCRQPASCRPRGCRWSGSRRGAVVSGAAVVVVATAIRFVVICAVQVTRSPPPFAESLHCTIVTGHRADTVPEAVHWTRLLAPPLFPACCTG